MPKLVIRDEDRTYLVDLTLDDGVVVGRSATCDLPLVAGRVSRRHGEIAPENGGHVYRDLGSTNGTVRNGATIEAPAQLMDGDVLDVGGCLITYRSRP